MATFTKIGSADRALIAKDLGWVVDTTSVPTTQDEWDRKLHTSSVVVNPETAKYVEALCVAGWDVQSGAERAYVAQHSGACPWKLLSDRDRDRLIASSNVAERIAARQKLCERHWDDTNDRAAANAALGLNEREFLRATGAPTCEWSDMSDAWRRAAVVATANGRGATSADARWSPVYNAICKRLPWERTDDERQLLYNLCPGGVTMGGVCAPCEMICVSASPERQLMVVAVAMFILMFILILLK
jgi:hypothetical protein